MKTIHSDKRVHRIMSQSVISGVCAGLARYLGIDALWVRIAAVVALCMMPALTLVAYLAAVIILPRWS